LNADGLSRQLDPLLRARIEASSGRRVLSARFVDRGYTPAERWIVVFEDGSSAFAKAGVDSATSAPATWLRRERVAYTSIEGQFMPRMLGWDDDGVRPLLLLENLERGEWPPPWSSELVEAATATLGMLAATRPPDSAPDLELVQREHLSGWRRVAADPLPFLGLGVVDEEWLSAALPALLAAADRAVLAGDALVHLDVRSDNLCVLDGVAKLIDWPEYAKGNPGIDAACLALSVSNEAGVAPESVLADSEGMASLLAGYFAAQAGLAPIPTAPDVRELQRRSLMVALPWSIRELGLPALDGPRAPPD
jgi:hypothetical protein